MRLTFKKTILVVLAVMAFFLIFRPAVGTKGYYSTRSSVESNEINLHRPYYFIPRKLELKGITTGEFGFSDDPSFAATDAVTFKTDAGHAIDLQYFLINGWLSEYGLSEKLIAIRYMDDIYEFPMPDNWEIITFSRNDYVPLVLDNNMLYILASDHRNVGASLPVILEMAIDKSKSSIRIFSKADGMEWRTLLDRLEGDITLSLDKICGVRSKTIHKILEQYSSLACDRD